ncbi:unnamed protein product [Protopolystoma xenopodis]|uniref:VWFA domain-containing protein n=1 Tax=Protopolystoma xenopodis TaxID=117903 RepID=A0A3S4ZKQ6_9PLAT|nr:unnamed protein product [Protopolystoma xenopodis]
MGRMTSESPSQVVHAQRVYSCGSAGRCLRRVVELRVSPIEGCRCQVRLRERSEACCCPTVMAEVQTAEVSGRRCDEQKGVLIRSLVNWRLHAGTCWPIIRERYEPIGGHEYRRASGEEPSLWLATLAEGVDLSTFGGSLLPNGSVSPQSQESQGEVDMAFLKLNYELAKFCAGRESTTSLGACTHGLQKHLVTSTRRSGCICQVEKRIILKPCFCNTLTAVEVIFLVDESVSARQPDYPEGVRQLLRRVILLFDKAASGNGQANNYRFALVKYASHPSVLLNLDEFAPASLVGRKSENGSFGAGKFVLHVDKMGYLGRMSNLGNAFQLVREQNFPLLLITHGVCVNYQDQQAFFHSDFACAASRDDE